MTERASPDGRYRWVATKRRTREDGRFIAGRGRFVADVDLPGMQHVALVTSPHPAARVKSIRTEAAAKLPGVHAVLTGAELAAATEPQGHGLDVPNIHWYPMAVDVVRYVGEWIVAVAAESRYIAEDAAELVEIEYEPLPFVIDVEKAVEADAPPVHEDHGGNLLYQRIFVWGPVEADFAAADHQLAFRCYWGRSAPVPIETFGVAARWDPGNEILDVWASIQMPKYAEQLALGLRLPANAVRAHYDVDVGGSYGLKRGLKHSVLVGYLARKLGRPVRLIEDRLENMAGGDAHGPDRIFDVEIAFDQDGALRSLKLRALDDVGAYPGRAPLQLGKPVGSIVGPYRIKSVQYEAISATTNKTSQEAVRGFGQAPTNIAIELAVDKVARFLDMDRLEVRRRNFIRKEEFPYTIPSGTQYDSGDYLTLQKKLEDLADLPALIARRDALRAEGRLAGIGIASCLEPGGGNAAFEPLMNPKNPVTTWMESCQIKVDMAGTVTVMIATPTAGQGHQTLASTVVGEELGLDPNTIRVVHADTLSALPGNTPVASRMAIMLGGAASGAAGKLKDRLKEIAAHNLDIPAEALAYERGNVFARDEPAKRLTWTELATIAHREYHRMPPGSEPGLQATHVWQVPSGGDLPSEDGRVQMYPCFSAEMHMPLVEIDRRTGQVGILEYYVGHDCGTVINPDIVRGMTLGGIAQGIGAALYEEFAYDEAGQLLAGSFMDYPVPSVHEVPEIKMVEHCTPSPLTPMGQKGAGEGGYLGAPAGLISAVNDALAPLGIEMTTLPMRARDIEAAIHAKRSEP